MFCVVAFTYWSYDLRHTTFNINYKLIRWRDLSFRSQYNENLKFLLKQLFCSCYYLLPDTSPFMRILIHHRPKTMLHIKCILCFDIKMKSIFPTNLWVIVSKEKSCCCFHTSYIIHIFILFPSPKFNFYGYENPYSRFWSTDIGAKARARTIRNRIGGVKVKYISVWFIKDKISEYSIGSSLGK